MVDMHTRVSGLLGAYALHAVDADERLLVEQHAEVCQICRSELGEHQEVAAALGILDGAEQSQSWEPIASLLGEAPDSGASRTTWYLMAAGVALVLLSVGFVVQEARVRHLTDRAVTAESRLVDLESENERQLVARAALAAQEDPARRISLGVDDAVAQVTIVLTESGVGYLTNHALPALDPDRTYQLWAVVDGEVISAGLLGSQPELVSFRIDPQGLEAFAVTEEAYGGVAVSDNPPVVAWTAEPS